MGVLINCLLLVTIALLVSCGGGGGGGAADTVDPVITALTGLPAAGNVSGTAALAVQASDDTAVTQITLSVDGTQVAQSAAATLNFSLDTTTLTNGAHTLVATARDAAGNTATQTVTFTVANGGGGGGTATLSGTVLIPAPGGGTEPGVGALVYVPARAGSAVGDPPAEESESFAYSEADGSFILAGLVPGPLTVNFELGLLEGSADVVIEDGDNELDPADSTLEEVADSDWATHLVTPQASENFKSIPHRAAVAMVSGRPAMCFIRNEGNVLDTLTYAIAPNADGSGVWTTVEVDTAFVIKAVSMLVVDGKPAIAFVASDPEEDFIRIALSSVPDGTSTWTSITVDQLSAVDNQAKRVEGPVSLALIGGRPAIAFSSIESVSGPILGVRKLHYAFTNSTNGAGSWAVTAVDEALGGFYVAIGAPAPTAISLAEVAGKPCIAFNYSETTEVGIAEAVAELRYYIGDSPALLGGWREVTVDLDNRGTGASLAVVDGRPAITFIPDDAAAAPSASVSYAFSSQVDGGGGWATLPIEVSAPGFVLEPNSRTILTTVGDGWAMFACTVIDPAAPDVNAILIANSYRDSDDATFSDSFHISDPQLPEPLNATQQVLAGLVDHANSSAVGYAAVTGTGVTTIAFTTLK
jgi:hypothetical protein